MGECKYMNLMHLKYVVEIDKTRSISKAAENLYMGQPNLSRSIKELEQSLQITIFKRTPKGIEVTPDGEEFIQYAKKILADVETDKSYPGDNRLITPKSSHRRSGLAPRCRLIASWSGSTFQGLGCSPIKAVRELGSERRETVRSLSVAGGRYLKGAVLSTRGPGWTYRWFISCHTSGMAE